MSASMTFTPSAARAVCASNARPARAAVRACATRRPSANAPLALTKRELLAGLSAATFTALLPAGPAAAVEFELYQGLASPPTSYGGYGGNADEPPKYEFQVPSGWKFIKPNKVMKGTQGIDCLWQDPKNKRQAVFVIVLGRAGEDGKQMSMRDPTATLAGFAGADFELQDAVTFSDDITTGSYVKEDQSYYTYAVQGPDVNYDITVTFYRGKVYAQLIKWPAKSYDANLGTIQNIQSTFRTLDYVNVD